MITYIDKKKTNVSTSNFDEQNLLSLIERSVQQTKVSPKDEFVGLPQKDHLENKIPDLDLYDQNILSYNFKQNFTKQKNIY